jgi:hypothetical protein
MRTYRRARSKVGVVATKTSDGWKSGLPGQECQECQEFRGGDVGNLDDQLALDTGEPT